MLKKLWIMMLVIVLVTAFGTLNVMAQDDGEPVVDPCPLVNNDDETYGTTSYFCDGRLNAFDLMEPVALYYDTEDQVSWDADDEMHITTVINGLEIWAVDSEGHGQLAMYIPASELLLAMQSTGDHLMASNGAISLSCSPLSRTFWVDAPGYKFAWSF